MMVTNGSASLTAAKVRTEVRTSKFKAKAQLALNFNRPADRMASFENRQTALETINDCMQKVTTVELTRDCTAVQIPDGASVMLPRGTSVDITQTLGGSYTIHAQGALFRVAGTDADALGMEASAKSSSGTGDAGELSEQQIWDTLRTCYDPEIPVNIVDLGLVYDMQCKTLPNGHHAVDVRMTLTAPGCGMGPSIAGDAQQKLLCLDGVEDARVEIVWDPPWHQSMITAEGRRILGLE
jgi:probable FeS assembly SUF system protein SufT